MAGRNDSTRSTGTVGAVAASELQCNLRDESVPEEIYNSDPTGYSGEPWKVSDRYFPGLGLGTTSDELPSIRYTKLFLSKH